MELTPRAAMSLSMALHELCTNAMKYGALSNDRGRVELTWEKQDEGQVLRLVWAERDGPTVNPPERKGFGTRLLERSLQAEIGASVELNYHPSGLTCEIVSAVANVA